MGAVRCTREGFPSTHQDGFPVQLQVIEEQLRMNGRWEGKLIHMRRDGSKVAVLSHWDLQQDPHSQDRSTTVVEINGPPSDFQLRVIREGIAFVPESTEMFKRSTSMPENFLNIG